MFKVGDKVRVLDELFPNAGTVTAVHAGVVAVRVGSGFVLPFTAERLALEEDIRECLQCGEPCLVYGGFWRHLDPNANHHARCGWDTRPWHGNTDSDN